MSTESVVVDALVYAVFEDGRWEDLGECKVLVSHQEEYGEPILNVSAAEEWRFLPKTPGTLVSLVVKLPVAEPGTCVDVFMPLWPAVDVMKGEPVLSTPGEAPPPIDPPHVDAVPVPHPESEMERVLAALRWLVERQR